MKLAGLCRLLQWCIIFIATDICHGYQTARPATTAFRPHSPGAKQSGFALHEKASLDSSSNSDTYGLKISQKYYLDYANLVWSQGYWKKLLLATVLLGYARYSLYSNPDVVLGRLPAPLRNTFVDMVLPLLASSCCLIQMVINWTVVGSGCLGFNRWLGPVRPFCMALMIVLTESFARMGQKTLFTHGVRWAIVFLPEFTHALNSFLLRRKSYRSTHHSGVNTTVRMSIPSMGCVACVNKINASVNRIPGVTQVSSALTGKKGGETTIVLETKLAGPNPLRQIQKAIESAGFPVESVQSS